MGISNKSLASNVSVRPFGRALTDSAAFEALRGGDLLPAHFLGPLNPDKQSAPVLLAIQGTAKKGSVPAPERLQWPPLQSGWRLSASGQKSPASRQGRNWPRGWWWGLVAGVTPRSPSRF